MDKSTEPIRREVDLAYQVHYNRQLLMKILAHVIAEDCPQNEDKENRLDRTIIDFTKYLNAHYAKVHFTQDEITDITEILEESKKFI